MTRVSLWMLLMVTGLPVVSMAQPALPTSASPALVAQAAKRFPQPVRVGDLRDRQVLEPSNHQGVLGRVAGVSREADGGLRLVFRYGGLLGLGTRLIGVPVEATALLGQFVQVTDIDQSALKTWPVWTGAGAVPLGDDEVIRVGINRN